VFGKAKIAGSASIGGEALGGGAQRTDQRQAGPCGSSPGKRSDSNSPSGS
jgi:hypothetical protein